MTTSISDEERAGKATAAQERASKRQDRRAKLAERLERVAYSVDETAAMLGRDPATVHRWVKAGSIASAKVGGTRLIPAAELKQIAAGQFGTKDSGSPGDPK